MGRVYHDFLGQILSIIVEEAKVLEFINLKARKHKYKGVFSQVHLVR